MPDTPPLFFPQALNEPGRWRELGKTHSLSTRDFEWLAHIKLSTHAKRLKQTPPMTAETLYLSVTGDVAVKLAGCFMLSAAPDDNGVILYTPYGGIRKFDTFDTLQKDLIQKLKVPTERDALFRLLSMTQRSGLAGKTIDSITRDIIEGDVFDDQRTWIQQNLQQNAQTLFDELVKLPSLDTLLNETLASALSKAFPGLDQRLTQVNRFTQADGSIEPDTVVNSPQQSAVSLSTALMRYYRHQHWPNSDRTHEYRHPARLHPSAQDKESWDNAIKKTAAGLIPLLTRKILDYWDHVLPSGKSRRALFIEAIRDRARADILFKRQTKIITPEQEDALEVVFNPGKNIPGQPPLVAQSIRLWEYAPHFVELAGAWMIAQPDAYLYTPAEGLQVLGDYQDLLDTVKAKFSAAGHEDELFSLLTREERNRFIGFKFPQVSGDPISGSVFETLFNGIIAAQAQNMEYALGVFRHSDGTVNIGALFDQALDVRTMIDNRMLTLENQGRWSTRPVTTGNQRPSAVLADKAYAFVRSFESVRSALDLEFKTQPTGNEALQRAFLEKMKPRLAHAMWVGIRGESQLRLLNRTLPAPVGAIIDAALAPEYATRSQPLNGFRPDVYSIRLECSAHDDLILLANCFLLTERGGLDPRHSGRAVLWTPALGLEAFTNVSLARDELQRRLADDTRRLSLLENLNPAQRKVHARYSLGAFRLIVSNPLFDRQQSAIEQVLASHTHLKTLKLTESQLKKAADALKQQSPVSNLIRATEVASAIRFQQVLPAWLGMAPTEEQQLHFELLQQHADSVTDEKDYLHGIKPLQDYVREQLDNLQKSQFNGQYIDPDLITITPTLAIIGPAQSLTAFALNHNVLEGSGFSVASTSATALPVGMSTATVRQLLLKLDIQKTYTQYLAQYLSANDSDAQERKRRYLRQLPWQLLQTAHALTLQEKLSGNAFDLIRQVVDMPDAIARAAVKGANAIARPLELIATGGARIVKAAGMYLIGPANKPTELLVLYTPYYTESVFSEFKNEASLLAALNTPGALQDLLIRRLPESDRTTYQNLFKETVGKATEITLASNPFQGNFLRELFTDNIRLLTQMLSTQSARNGQPDWQAIKSLFSSGIKLVEGFLPGKLSYITVLWQAYQDFKDSAEALQQHHWKRALESFIDGGAQMITMGRMLLEPPASTPARPTATEETSPSEQPVSAPQWSQIRTTAVARTQAKSYEVHDVDLQALTKNTKNGTYRDPVTRHLYAPVQGKVYRVKKTGVVWHMSNGQQAGPTLSVAPGPELVLAADVHTIHYGKAYSTLANKHAVISQARDVLNIEARGMNEIRRKFPARAQAIVQAVDLARFYASNSLHNLSQLNKLLPGTRLDTFLKDFFDVKQVDDVILKKIKDVILPICTELANPMLDALDYSRFIVGSSRSPDSRTLAFVLSEDRKKNVFFTNHFFDQQLDWHKSSLTEPFDVDAHAQAATLIHEFSHLYSNTFDIAHLEARRPFSDLITTVTRHAQKMKNTQEVFQRRALSMSTPHEELFARWNAELAEWVSLDEMSGTEDIGKAIKKISSASTMDDARKAFLDINSSAVRVDIILRNADSVTRLICEMGRQLDAPPPETP